MHISRNRLSVVPVFAPQSIHDQSEAGIGLHQAEFGSLHCIRISKTLMRMRSPPQYVIWHLQAVWFVGAGASGYPAAVAQAVWFPLVLEPSGYPAAVAQAVWFPLIPAPLGCS